MVKSRINESIWVKFPEMSRCGAACVCRRAHCLFISHKISEAHAVDLSYYGVLLYNVIRNIKYCEYFINLTAPKQIQ